jgi:hypothetical protein
VSKAAKALLPHDTAVVHQRAKPLGRGVGFGCRDDLLGLAKEGHYAAALVLGY